MPNSDINQANTNFYNVKILAIYVAYLRQELDWSNAEIDHLFDLCGTDIGLLSYDDNTFNQDLADKFHDTLVELTGDNQIAYHVGAYATHHSAKGLVGGIVSGFLYPAVSYRNIGRIAAEYSTGALMTAEKVGHNAAVIRATPVPGCEEKPYQCQNRIGMLESVPTLFKLPKAVIEHPKCFHNGDEYCEYHVRWIEQSFRYAPHLSLLLFCALFLLLGLQTTNLLHAFLISLGIAGGTYSVLDRISNQRLNRALNDQIEALRVSHNTIERRHQESTLVSKIHLLVSRMMPVNSLCDIAAKAIHEHMGYDRVTIFLYDSDNNTLRAVAYSGVNHNDAALLTDIEFNVKPDNASGFITSIVHTGKPIFVRDVGRELARNSERSQEIIKRLRVKSFAAVPIRFEDTIFGVLAVDNTIQTKLLTHNDLKLLSSVSLPLGVSFANANSFEKLQNSKNLLEELVEERTRELANARDEAVRANNAKSQFLANMSHELRTPLNAILGFSQLIYHEANESELEQIASDSQKVIKSANHLLTLISDLLDLSKIEAGKMELYIEKVNIDDMLETVKQITEELAKVKQNAFSMQVDPEIKVLWTDEKKLKQILLNLLSNACKFTKNGKVSLTVSHDSEQADHILFEVSDTGIGIPQDKLHRLFHDFNQIDSSTSKKYGGTGLGLSLSKRFADLMGATITLDSCEGSGSTFRLSTPRQISLETQKDTGQNQLQSR